MKKLLLKVNNNELSHRVKVNYNNLYSQLRMLLGAKASLFAEISEKSGTTSWYADDNADYHCLGSASPEERTELSQYLSAEISSVQKTLSSAKELSSFSDILIEVPDEKFIFYRKNGNEYKFILAGWGCKYIHQNIDSVNLGIIKKIINTVPGSNIVINPDSDHVDEKIDIHNIPDLPDPDVSGNVIDEGDPVRKTQNVVLKVIDQKNGPLVGEVVHISWSSGNVKRITSDDGTAEVGSIIVGEIVNVIFPDIQGAQKRSFEVEPNMDVYEVHVKKFRKYSPVLFVEDQEGRAVRNIDIKILFSGQEFMYNSGNDGVISLPVMQEDQKFIAIEAANYANTKEYVINSTEAKAPYHFYVQTSGSKKGEESKVVNEVKPNFPAALKWLALVPVLALLVWGGFKFFKGPTLNEMSSGVVLVRSDVVYYVDTGLKDTYYFFTYDENSKEITHGTFDIEKVTFQRGSGTGFLISEDGLIATNRHVADPIPPQHIGKVVKNFIFDQVQICEEEKKDIVNLLNKYKRLSGNPDYAAIIKELEEKEKELNDYITEYNRVLTINDFEVHSLCKTYVAFKNTIAESLADVKIECMLMESGDADRDVAIIQIKDYRNAIPKDAYIFNVPKKDLLDKELPDNYEVTVVGYNYGLVIASGPEGIVPQKQTGTIMTTNETYTVGYSANTLPGSSGSPVLNKKHQLVAINNSGYGGGTQGFNYGVRTKYLRELLDDINKNKNKKKQK